jgi:hypothetical protein
MGDAPTHDPRAYLEQAERAFAAAGEPMRTGSLPKSGAEHAANEAAYDRRRALILQEAQAFASMATAAAMLMPTPEEVIATYEETRTEVLGEVQGDLVTRLHRTKRILEDAVRDGSRRHPAIHAALEALGDLDG